MSRSVLRRVVSRSAAVLGALVFLAGCESGGCITDDACEAGNECSAGQCVPVALCATSAQCADGFTCLDGKCRAPCVDAAQCSPWGLECASGLCMPIGSAGGVMSTLGAGGGGVTTTQPTASGPCTTAEQCGANATCMAGMCVAASTPMGMPVETSMAAGAGGGTQMPPTQMPGAGAGGGGTQMPEMPEMPDPDAAMLEDFEDGDGVILPKESRLGQWYSYNDGVGTMVPAVGEALVPEAGGADGTGFALHTSGSGFSDWGAGIAADLNNTTAEPWSATRQAYDLSAYGGISFWAKGTGTVRFKIPTLSTVSADEQGSCAPAGDVPCGDDFGVDLTLAADWQRHDIAFASLSQQDWGVAATFDPAEALGIRFQHTDTASGFDFWIDEIEFTGGQSTNPNEPDPPMTNGPPPDPNAGQPGTCQDLGGYQGNGSVTFYTFSMGSSEVNCSYPISGESVPGIPTGDGRHFGAMNTSDYAASAMCGACVEVTRDGNRSVTITIVDQCPVATNDKCRAGHIDLSRDAFLQLGSEGEGYLGTGNGGAQGSISWRYVECPVNGDVTFRLKEADNANWNQVVVQGHRYPLQSVDVWVGGAWVAAARQDYNYWEPPNGNMGNAPYWVRATDVTGATVTAEVPLASGAHPGTPSQFPACQ